nr:unnamed protein product [Callosobruchus analis]
MNPIPRSEKHSDWYLTGNAERHLPAIPSWSHHARSNNSSSHHYTNPHHYENSSRDCTSEYYNDIPINNGYLKTVSGRVDGDFYYYFNDSPAAQKDILKQRRDTSNLAVKSDETNGSTNYCTVCLWFIAVGFGLYFIPKFLWR